MRSSRVMYAMRWLLAVVLLVLAGCECGGRRVVCAGDVQCSAGETTCGDGVLRSCLVDENGCSSWASPSTCPGGQCASATSCEGACVHGCAVGEVSCVGGQRAECQADGRGCRALITTACASGFCSGTSCGVCTDGCPSAGATSCESGALRTCTADANGCLAWSAPTACAGNVCGTPETCGTCAHGCDVVGATSCAGGQLRTCAVDANGCRDWAAPTACPSGFCASGAACGTCTDACSTTGGTECASGQLRTCVADAHGCRGWTAPSACASGFCANAASCGTCTHECATVGATACTSGALRTCTADVNGCRAWAAPVACSSGFCASAASCGVCTNGCASAGLTECTGGQLRTCTADGNGCLAWSQPTACSSGFCGSAQACGACTNGCAASGQTECAGGQLRTCTADGNGCLAWSAAVACPGPGLCRSATQCDRAPLAALTCSSPVVQGGSATLDASGSSDPDGDALTFRYGLPDGGAVDGGSTLQATLTTVGAAAFSVEVRDPAGATATASCSVQVTCAPETDLAFCQARGKNCGTLSGTDVCGQPRTASCGACTLPEVCGLATANVCGAPNPASIPAPRAVTPMSLATVARPRPTFSWVLAAGADGAQVEVCPDRACVTPTLTFAATGTSAVPPVDLTGRVVFWRLRGRLGATNGTATSPVWQFTLRKNANGVDVSWGHVPDFDNDGFADAVISAYQEPKTYFYRGGAAGLTQVGTYTGFASAGPTELDAAGDVNGDGFCDVLLQDRLLFGSASGVNTSSAQTVGSFLSIHRAAGVGDVNHDGFSDVAVVYLGTGGVRLELFFGSATGVGAASQSFVLGTNNNWYVGPAGDVNGDGFADVAVTNCWRFSCASPGTAWLYLGGPSGLQTTASWSRTSSGGNRIFVSGPGDFDGDGYADLAVSTWELVSVYRGSAAVFAMYAPLSLSQPPSSLAGWAAALDLGDFNGDGRDDLFIGDSDREQVSVHLAPALTAISTVTTSLASENHDFGATLVNAGDVTGDGFADLLVGAPAAPQPATWDFVQGYWGNANGTFPGAGTQVLRGGVRNRQFGYALR